MSEIFDQSAYSAGAEEAKKLAEQIKGYISSLPTGFRAEVRGEQLFMFAPHNLYASPGNWAHGYDNSGKEFSHIWLSYLTEESWNKFMESIKKEIAAVEQKEGFKQKLTEEFAPLQKQEETPPKPKPAEPEKPKLSDRELRLRELETEIAENVNAVELANELGLTEQVKSHEANLTHLRKVAEAVRKGYKEVQWDEQRYSSKKLDAYAPPIPSRVLESLKSAKHAALFDSFGIWEEMDADDPVLIGKVQNDRMTTRFHIDGW